MNKKTLFEDLQERVSQIIDQSPVKDLEKNLRAMISQVLARLDMVTREEYDTQTAILTRMSEQISQLQARVTKLEEQARQGKD